MADRAECSLLMWISFQILRQALVLAVLFEEKALRRQFDTRAHGLLSAASSAQTVKPRKISVTAFTPEI